MAVAKKCDRCGKFFEPYNYRDDSSKINGIMTLNLDSTNRYFTHGPYDLCPSCSTELMNWFNASEEKE